MAASRAAGYVMIASEPDTSDTADDQSNGVPVQTFSDRALVLVPLGRPALEYNARPDIPPHVPDPRAVAVRANDRREDFRPVWRAATLRELFGQFWTGRAHA